MRLWYQKPAEKWCEALPIGNGALGAMVFGNPEREMLQLNEDSVWSGKKLNRINPDAQKYLPKIRALLREGKISEAEKLTLYALSGTPNSERSYQTAGEFYLNCPDCKQYTDYQRELDLEEGMIRVSWRTGETCYSREYLASYPDGVIACKMKAEGPGRLNFDCRVGRQMNCQDETEASSSGLITMMANTGEAAITFCVGVKVSVTDGGCEKIGEHLVVTGASEAVIYLKIMTSYRTENVRKTCMAWLEEAAAKGWEQIRERHIADYRKLFARLTLTLHGRKERKTVTKLPTDERLLAVSKGADDPELMALYFQYGRYLLIASSRPGALPANLQGIWNDSMTPPWGSKFTININTEMNYWIAESGNLAECHVPLFEHLEKVKENGKRTARDMYGCRGSVAHHNTDIYGDTAPQDHWVPASFWVMGEAWLATHIWEHYEYTLDQEFLKKYFDIIEQCVLFFEDFLIESKDGYLVASPTLSPENTYRMEDGTEGHLCEGCAMDNEILTELLTDYLRACTVLGLDEKKPVAEKMLSRLQPPAIGSEGRLLEWGREYEEPEPGHRHISHLYGVYPGTSFDYENTPELMEACKKSLEYRLAKGGGHTGWSRAWIIGLWAKFRDGEKAYENYKALLAHSTFPNLMDNHPMFDYFVFQIDGNFGASAAVIEMLVQSRGDEIWLLPALPSVWTDGSVSGVCLRGGGEISMQWRDGKVSQVALLTPMERSLKLHAHDECRNVTTKGNERYQIDLKRE